MPKYSVSNVAGYSDSVGNGGVIIDATIRRPNDMCFSPSRNTLFFTDHTSIRKVSLTDGIVSIFQDDQTKNAKGITMSNVFVYHTQYNGVYFTNIDNYSPSNNIVSGVSGFEGDGGSAKTAKVNNPTCLFYSAFDSCLYICDTDNHRIRKINTNTSIITTIAGNGDNDFNGDGNMAVNTSLSYPQGIYVSQQSGNIYIADTGNNRIRMILTNGTIVTIAGNGNAGYNGDDVNALQTSLNHPVKIWMNGNETEMFIADMSNNRVRKLNIINGIMTTIAGGGIENGEHIVATTSNLYEPRSIVRNSLTDELYIIETKADRIIKLTQTGILSRFGGDIVQTVHDTKLLKLKLGKTYGITKLDGVIYLSQSLNHKIILASEAETSALTWGSGQSGFAGDGLVVGSNTQFNFPTSITFSNQTRTIYLADTYNHRIRKIDPITKIITTIAGTGIAGYNGDGIMATSAQLNNPMSVSVWFNGTHDIVYIADTRNQRVRRILPSGMIETVLGKSRAGNSMESLRNPNSISVHSDGTLFIADTENKRFFKTNLQSFPTVFDHTQPVTAILVLNNILYFADTDLKIYTRSINPDQSVNSLAIFQDCEALGFSDNNLNLVYVADMYNYVVRTITPNTVNSGRLIGNYKINQDRSLATKMKVASFSRIATWNGEIFAVDGSSTIYSIKSDGRIDVLAGTVAPLQMYEIDSLEASSFSFLSGLSAVNGFIYASDTITGRIWKIDTINKSIVKIAGSSTVNLDEENVDAKSVLMQPRAITNDDEYLYLFDTTNAKMRKISFSTGNITTVAGSITSNPKDVKIAPLNSPISVWQLVLAPMSKQLHFVESVYYYLKKISGNSIMLLGYPKRAGLAMNSDDTIFVGGINCVSRLNLDGTITNITGPVLSGDPVDIAAGTNGDIFVASAKNIYKLSPYCDSGYSLNGTSWCTPICFGFVGSVSCGGSLQGNCIAPDTCQCNTNWNGTQCSILISDRSISNEGQQTVLIGVLVPLFIISFIIVLVIVIVVILIFYMKMKKQRSNKAANFEMKEVNASAFDQISDFPTDDSSFKPLSGSMSSITNSEVTFDPLSRYKELIKIGQGAFGSVFKAFDTKTNRYKALKIIKFQSFGELNSIMKEGMQLMNIDHPNILKVNDLFVDKQEILCMDMEFYEKGDLLGLINSKDVVSEKIVKQIVYQMSSALDFVHSNLKSIHRDVKPSNIFIKSLDDHSIHIILADFGLAKDSQASMALQSYAGTPLYMSPELGLGASYGSNTDIYSLGVTIFQIITKDCTTAISHLYLSKDEMQVAEILTSKMESGKYSNELISVCLKMLTKDPSTRPSARNILNDPYFNK